MGSKAQSKGDVMDKKAELVKLVLTVCGKTIELSSGEAKELGKILNEIFGGKKSFISMPYTNLPYWKKEDDMINSVRTMDNAVV